MPFLNLCMTQTLTMSSTLDPPHLRGAATGTHIRVSLPSPPTQLTEATLERFFSWIIHEVLEVICPRAGNDRTAEVHDISCTYRNKAENWASVIALPLFQSFTGCLPARRVCTLCWPRRHDGPNSQTCMHDGGR